MKTQRKNKNKLTKRSNKKNKQNKKTQKRKQSGGNPSRRLSRTLYKLLKIPQAKCEKTEDSCEIYLKLKVTDYRDEYDELNLLNRNDNKKIDYVRMKICKKIDKMLNNPGISDKVRKYLNDIRDDTCGENSQGENSEPLLDLTENFYLDDP
jgi:activator of HSP90 ATPase